MTVNLSHPNVTQMTNLGVFDNITTIEEMCRKISDISVKEIDLLPEDSLREDQDPRDMQRKFRGNAFEVFGEFFCHFTSNHAAIGVRDGVMVDSNDDVGVDLLGKGLNDEDVAVQFKFRGKANDEFFHRDLSTFFSAAANLYNVTGRNQILITTVYQKQKDRFGADRRCVNHIIDRINPTLRIIGRQELKELTDNQKFWNDFGAALQSSKRLSEPRINKIPTGYQQRVMDAIGDWL
jgi:predicted helicase